MKNIKIMSIFAVLLLSLAVYGTNPSTVFAIESVNTCTDGIDNDFNTLSDEADPSCTESSTQEGVTGVTTPAVPEVTHLLCTDGIDNDFNTLSDEADPSCSTLVTPVIETTYALCTDGLDNDFNTLSDEADPSCATALAPTPVTENTLALCKDGIDNDFNTLSDEVDPSCASILDAVNDESGTTSTGTPETTYALCTDGLDNDFNTLSDEADPSCAGVQAPTTPTTPTTPTINPATLGPVGGSSNGGGSSGGSGITVGTPISATATSTVIGIDPNCSQLFKTYMGYGKVNNKAEVIRLQTFLNTHMNAKLAVDGKFGKKTVAAVKAFQAKYASAILLPWDVAGLSTNLVANPTGYVYKTTQYQLNLLVCPLHRAPTPILP